MVTVQTAGTFAHYQGGGLFRAIDGSGWLFAELPAQPPDGGCDAWLCMAMPNRAWGAETAIFHPDYGSNTP